MKHASGPQAAWLVSKAFGMAPSIRPAGLECLLKEEATASNHALQTPTFGFPESFAIGNSQKHQFLRRIQRLRKFRSNHVSDKRLRETIESFAESYPSSHGQTNI